MKKRVVIILIIIGFILLLAGSILYFNHKDSKPKENEKVEYAHFDPSEDSEDESSLEDYHILTQTDDMRKEREYNNYIFHDVSFSGEKNNYLFYGLVRKKEKNNVKKITFDVSFLKSDGTVKYKTKSSCDFSISPECMINDYIKETIIACQDYSITNIKEYK